MKTFIIINLKQISKIKIDVILTYAIITFITIFFVACGDSNNSSLDIWNKDDDWVDKDIIENEDALTINHNGIAREYVLHVPDSYDSETPVPLMISFHGGGGTATGQMYMADMRPIADTANFILVYPQGLHLSDGGSTHWNSMLLSDSNKSSVDDFGFIDALINHLSSTYNIDSTRLYATGFSNGADISFTLGCFLDNKIAAVAPVSGLMLNNPSSNCNPPHRVGIMIIHGTSDNARPTGGIEGYYASIDETILFWSNLNLTSLNPNITGYTADGLTVEHHLYSDQNNTAYIEYYKVVNGDHIWLNITREGLNTNQLIWNFVSKFRLEIP